MHPSIVSYLENCPGTVFVLLPNGDGTWLASIEDTEGEVLHVCETDGTPQAAIDTLASEL